MRTEGNEFRLAEWWLQNGARLNLGWPQAACTDELFRWYQQQFLYWDPGVQTGKRLMGRGDTDRAVQLATPLLPPPCAEAS